MTKKFPLGADVPDHDENVITLLKHGHLDAERKDDVHGRTVLSWAASYKYIRIASELIQIKDVDLETRDVHGRTPLSEAAGSGSLEIWQLLIATGRFDLNLRDSWDHTLLSWAARNRHAEVVKHPLSNPTVLLDTQNIAGETALDIARKLEQNETVKILEGLVKR